MWATNDRWVQIRRSGSRVDLIESKPAWESRNYIGTLKTVPEYSGAGILDVMSKLSSQAITGKLPTKFKTAVNRRSGIPGQHRAYPGELHPMHKVKVRGKNRYAFGNFLGPNTNVQEKLRKGVMGISRADNHGRLHDINFSLAKTPKDLRKYDKRFIRGLKREEKRGEPKFNTRIGIRGIQLKNKLEDTGVWSKKKFLNPITNPKDIAIAKREKAKMMQMGYGNVPPADRLNSAIRRKLRRGGSAKKRKALLKKKQRAMRGSSLFVGGGFESTRPVPIKKIPHRTSMKVIRNRVRRMKRSMKKRRRGKGLKKDMGIFRKFDKEFKSVSGRRMRGKGLIPKRLFKKVPKFIVKNVLPIVIRLIAKKAPQVERFSPNIKDVAEHLIRTDISKKQKVSPTSISNLLMPILVKLFTKVKPNKKGSGIGLDIAELPFKMLAFLIKKAITAKREDMAKGRGMKGSGNDSVLMLRQMKGSGFWSFMKDFSEGFVDGFANVINKVGPGVGKSLGAFTKAALL